METAEPNRLLTQVGKGTPCGELLRRYWHPIAATEELRERWTKSVRLLGEDLVLFRDRQGRLGLIEHQCPHRRASFVHGLPTHDGLRCPYHGWEFDARGHCLSQPLERDNPEFRQKVAITAYPVQELGGLVFAYLGPQPAPLLPRLDGFVAEPAIRLLGHAVIPCNWLQIVETSLDPVHAEWLHGRSLEFLQEQEGIRTHISAPHQKIDFSEFDWGITKHRLLEGQSEDGDDWRVDHPIVFPTMLAVGNADDHQRSYVFQIRVPMDDEHTLHYWYHACLPPPHAAVPPRLLQRMHLHEAPFRWDDGQLRTDHIDGQDITAWLTQGPVADHTREDLGAFDAGIAMYRRMLRRGIKRVQQGHDPKGVIRDPALNTRIELPNEKGKKHFRGSLRTFVWRTHVRFSPVADALGLVFEP